LTYLCTCTLSSDLHCRAYNFWINCECYRQRYTV